MHILPSSQGVASFMPFAVSKNAFTTPSSFANFSLRQLLPILNVIGINNRHGKFSLMSHQLIGLCHQLMP